MSTEKYKHNPNHSIGTCGECGQEMTYNVPRMGPDEGFVHKATGKTLCDDQIQKAWDKMQEESNKISEHTPLDVLEGEIDSKLEEVLKERRKLVSTVLASDRKVDKLIEENQQLKLTCAELTTDYNRLKDEFKFDSLLTPRQRADRAIELYLISEGWVVDDSKGYMDPKSGEWHSSTHLCGLIQNVRDDIKHYGPGFGGYCIWSETLSKNNISIRDMKTLKYLT